MSGSLTNCFCYGTLMAKVSFFCVGLGQNLGVRS